MDGNVRGIVYTATNTEKQPAEMNLREATEWYKLIVDKVDNPNFAEVKYINETWAFICQEISKREGIPAGFLSYMLNELAVSEIRVRNMAEMEAQL